MADTDTIAEPRPCTRCTQPCLLSVVGRCADCVADMFFHHAEDYQAFKAEVRATYGTRS